MSDNPAQILKRAQPAWDNFQDAAKQARVLRAFQDMARVVNTVLEDTVMHPVVFQKYFAPNHATAVRAVLTNMVQPNTVNSDSGSDLISFIGVSLKDPRKWCFESSGKHVGAYTNHDWDPHQLGKIKSNDMIYWCPEVFNQPDVPLAPHDFCAQLDATVSHKMITLGGYTLVHELTHTIDIGQGPVAEFYDGGSGPAYKKIEPNKNIGDIQYGPQKTRLLLATLLEQGTVVINADNYAWFVAETYWSIICGHTFGAPLDNFNGVAGPQLGGRMVKFLTEGFLVLT